MKKIYSALILVFFVSFFSCDKIEAPYREPVVVNDFCKTGVEDSIVHKKVLVEDYTGHLCGNCPSAGIYLNDTLKATYNHCMVVVSVHAGFFAGTCPTALACPGNQPAGAYTEDYNCAAGNTWYTFFHIGNNPIGMVDRIDFPSSTNALSVSGWAPAIANQLAKAAQVKLTISNTYSSLTGSLNTSVQSDLLNDLTGNYMLQVVLTEDSIIDWQEWYGHTPVHEPNFIHHHVMRDVVNTTWGESIITGSATTGTSITKNYSYTLNNNWNADYCSVVAFVYDDATKEVLQVEEARVR